MKSDLWGLDLSTPVFLCGGNCFWEVPDPLTPHTALQSRKHDMYLTHVLFSSLWCCLFGVDVALSLSAMGGGLIQKMALFFFLLYQELLCLIHTLQQTLFFALYISNYLWNKKTLSNKNKVLKATLRFSAVELQLTEFLYNCTECTVIADKNGRYLIVSGILMQKRSYY